MARGLIRQVNSERPVIDRWTFGGGTALMLQIGHRESRDVDIFLEDAQFLPFLDPQKRDFKFDILPSDYGGDGTRFLKLAFDGLGEIDFIVDLPKTADSAIEQEIEGETILLETVPEIITKKVVHRGFSLKPRDIFDIAAAGEEHAAAIVAALRGYQVEVAVAIIGLQRLQPGFVKNAIAALEIRQNFRPLTATALNRTFEILRAV